MLMQWNGGAVESVLSTSTPIRLQLSDREGCRQTDRKESKMDRGMIGSEKEEKEGDRKKKDRIGG